MLNGHDLLHSVQRMRTCVVCMHFIKASRWVETWDLLFQTVLKVQKYYNKADALFDIEEVTEYCEDIDILMKQHKEVNEYDDVVLMEFHIRNDDGFDVSVYFHILRPLSMILGFTFYY